MVAHALRQGFDRVEVSKEEEEKWVQLILQTPPRVLMNECTPGYYNNEGQTPSPGAKYNVGYPHGATAYFEYLKGWRSSGEFEGLTFTPKRSESS